MENIYKKTQRRIFTKPTIFLQDTSGNTLIYSYTYSKAQNKKLGKYTVTYVLDCRVVKNLEV